jgi:hypothetical protein
LELAAANVDGIPVRRGSRFVEDCLPAVLDMIQGGPDFGKLGLGIGKLDDTLRDGGNQRYSAKFQSALIKVEIYTD